MVDDGFLLEAPEGLWICGYGVAAVDIGLWSGQKVKEPSWAKRRYTKACCPLAQYCDD